MASHHERRIEMFGKVWRRAGSAALAGAGAAVVLGAGVLGGAGANAAAVTPGSRSVAPQGVAAVPWKSVGAGWVLAETGTTARRGPVTLYLVSPAGQKYALHTFSASTSLNPALIAWSGDKTRALFELGSVNKLEQLNLQTGKASEFQLAGGGSALSYTLPTGQQVLAVAYSGSTATLATYSLSGKLVQVLASGKYSIEGSYAPNGTAVAVSVPTGLRLISSSGKVLKNLTVPNTASSMGCTPIRWWAADKVLAICFTKSGKSSYSHLYLVPASGARPTALTPARTSGRDLGDIDAWQLSSGLYLQSIGACGTLEINKQAANGSITPVPVPGTTAASYKVVTAAGPRLLVETLGCAGGGELVWFNPATHAETWLFKGGVSAVVPFASPQDAPQ
jgi:hypothetical protein